MSHPIGIEVTDNILARIDGFDRLMMKGLLDLADPADEDEQIAASAVASAVAKFWGNDKVSQAHVERFRALLHRV